MPKSSLSTPLTDSWFLCLIGTITSLNSCKGGPTCTWNILLFLCYNIGGRCCLSLQVLLILNTNIIRMVKVTNFVKCNRKHILKENYFITPFWNVPICNCLSSTCPFVVTSFPTFFTNNWFWLSWQLEVVRRLITSLVPCFLWSSRSSPHHWCLYRRS